MANIVTTEANNLLDATFGTSAHSAPTAPVKVGLTTDSPTASAAGTEVTGGSYARQDVSFTAAASGSTSNSAQLDFTDMPATTVTSINIWDSSATPVRLWFGDLSASKTTNSGDTLSFAIGAITVSLA